LPTDDLQFNPADPSDLYNLSKALGEALVFSSGVPALVLRLANVYGLDLGSRNFLSSIIRDAISRREVTLRTSLESTKNYVGVHDVVSALLALLSRGTSGTYNLAGRRNFSHREITELLASLTGCSVHVAPTAPTTIAPEISISRVAADIDYAPESVIDALPRLVTAYRRALT
jgi:nucleoside-diphosphate-sugar epimerase